MNIITVIILLTIIIDFSLHFLADILNLRMLKNELPDELQGFYDADRYRKSQEYLRVNTRFGWLTSIINLILILILWFGKIFPLLDQWARSFEHGPIITGLIYMGILILFQSLISLPFRIYSIFVIEERFGFNKTTWSTFFKDMIKGLIIGIILGIPLLTGLLAFFEYTGTFAWLYCWVAVTIFMLFVQFIAPSWIMPLFNKFEPIEDDELKNTIVSYAESIDYPLEGIYKMDGSKRSSKSNAFFTGFGKNKRIVLFDTLIEKHTVSELLSVLAHEMGHYKKKHVLQRYIIGILQAGVLFFLLSFFISYQGLFDAFFMENQSVYAGLIFFGMLFAPIDFFLGIIMQALSRKDEYEADRFAVQTTNDPVSMANALKKLSVDNLTNLYPHRLFVLLNYSHPPVLQRIDAIMNV